MQTIYKYVLYLTDLQSVTMPEGARILSAALDPSGHMCLWAAVDTNKMYVSRHIRIVGTGNPSPVDLKECTFIASVVDGPFVWHIFEELINEKDPQ